VHDGNFTRPLVGIYRGYTSNDVLFLVVSCHSLLYIVLCEKCFHSLELMWRIEKSFVCWQRSTKLFYVLVWLVNKLLQ
jgi:hypothetical protein